MKTAGIIVLILLVGVGTFWRLRYRGRWRGERTSRVVTTDGTSLYPALRNQILHGSRTTFGLPAAASPTEPWGVMMEMREGNATATVVAISDGTASIYLSNGGGYIGGGQRQESIRQAAYNMLAVARQFQPLMDAMNATQNFPLPESDQIVFYVLTDAGVFTASAPERELTGKHWLTNLYAAGQEIITQYRLSPQ